MSRHTSSLMVLLLVLLPAAFSVAQDIDRFRANGERLPLLVTARAGSDQVRFSALGLVRHVRLEVWNQAGDTVFDSQPRDGNLLDWTPEDFKGQRLPNGLYGCVLTVEDVGRRLSSRRAAFWLRDGAVRFGNPPSEGLEAASAGEDQELVTVLGGDEPRPFTTLAHDGSVGRIVSGSGGLSFRTGDLFAGKDVEHMRLTEDGRLGIGVEEPAAKLDVAGLIRADGILFADGTIQKTAAGAGITTITSEGFKLVSNGRTSLPTGPGAGASTVKGSSSFTAGGFGMLANSGSPGRVLGYESETNTYYGLGTGWSGSSNSLFGANAGYNNTGDFNSFFGYEAGYFNKASSNSFFGTYAGRQNTTGTWNAFFGSGAGYANTAGINNSFFGTTAGAHNTTANNNSFFGDSAGYSNTTGSEGSFFGTNAGYSNTTGSQNSFYGQNAGNSNNTGSFNAFFGRGAGQFNTSGFYNSFFGYDAGKFNSTGYYNSFFGRSAGYANTTGEHNSFFGDEAGYHNTTGRDNSFFGDTVGKFNTTGSENSFFGKDAGQSNTTGSANSFFGKDAGYSNTTGSQNSFFGWNAGSSSATGQNNSFFGQEAGQYNTTGNSNSFFGQEAGQYNTTGFGNDFFGRGTGFANTTGHNNSFFGNGAGSLNTTGDYNSFFGQDAGAFNSDGRYNSFFGQRAGYNSTTGRYNSFFGQEAGTSNTSEDANSFLGMGSNGWTGITNATAVGYLAQVKQSNSLVLGSIQGVNGATSDTKVGIGTTAPSAMLEVRKDQNGSTFIQVTNQADYADSSRARIALVGGTVTQEMQSIAGLGGYFGTTSSHPFNIYTNRQTRMTITDTGDVGIGIGEAKPTARLQVNGNLKVSGAILYGAPEMDLPDYVFEPDYRLMPIEKLDEFVIREKHLPGVPPASKIREKGINLGEFQMRLLEKIEELTLYAVQQAKSIRQKDDEVAGLKSTNADLAARLANLEQMVERLSQQK